jgi:hypothetical protein
MFETALRTPFAALALHVLDRTEKHAACAAGGVVDGLALLGVEDLDHHANDAARGVELARLLPARDIGELADQVLVRVAQDIGADGLVAERDGREALDQVLEKLVGELLLVAPVGIAEHAVKGVGVGLLDLLHRPEQGSADIARSTRGWFRTRARCTRASTRRP